MNHTFYVYIITNDSNKVLYIGITNNLHRRIYEHKNKLIEGFTKKYNLTKLIYLEYSNNSKDAISREKQLKNWHRNWKNDLISKFNPEWIDLSDQFEIEKDAEPSSA